MIWKLNMVEKLESQTVVTEKTRRERCRKSHVIDVRGFGSVGHTGFRNSRNSRNVAPPAVPAI